MDNFGEGSSEPVFYGPPKPPEMLQAEEDARIRAAEEAWLLERDRKVFSGEVELDSNSDLEYDSDELRELGVTRAPRRPRLYELCAQGPVDHILSGEIPLRDRTQHREEPGPADLSNPPELHNAMDTDDEDDDPDYETANSQPHQSNDDSEDEPNAQSTAFRQVVVMQDLQRDEDDHTDDEYIPGQMIEEEDDDEDDDEGEDDEDDEDDDDDDEEEDEAGDGNFADAGTIAVDLASLGGFEGGITRQQLIALLQTQNLADVFDFVDSDDSSEDFRPQGGRARRRVPPPEVKPTIEGMKLQTSGVFGANETSPRSKKPLMTRMLEREHGLGSLEDRRRNSGLLTQDMIPEMRAEHILHYDEPVYSGQFSDDGNFYYSVCQDFKVRMYDTSNPYDWKHYKTVSYPWGSWTLTDASLSPDNKWLVYASHSSLVSIAPTDPLDRGDPYTLNLEGGLEGRDIEMARRMNFSIFSIRFSGDGRELVAGTRQNTIVLFDIERRSVLHTIMGHENDVNAVCFGDKDEPHLIYSGSDDGVLKVWDRRSLNDRREAGAFVGHKGGLTYIDSKNDGRYILSNGKDQTAKLWDVRMAYSTDRFREEDLTQYTRYSEYDYRYMDDIDMDHSAHPKDNSVVTFRGHKVQRTLIRCHFAPPGSANSRYVYSGSSDGKVHVWNMDSTVAKIIDVGKATKGTRRNDGRRRYFAFDEDEGDWEACVRDVSWHPHAPVMAASAWNSYNMSRGTTSVHAFTGAHGDEDDVPMGRSYDAMMQRQEGLYDMIYD